MTHCEETCRKLRDRYKEAKLALFEANERLLNIIDQPGLPFPLEDGESTEKVVQWGDSVSALGISRDASKVLNRANILTAGELKEYIDSNGDLDEIEGMEPKLLDEIDSAIDAVRIVGHRE